MHVCDNCGSPFSTTPLYGRPWPDHPPATYCCYGCLTWGEHRRLENAHIKPDQSPGAALPRTLGIRLGISAIITAQIMIFGLSTNLHSDMPRYAKSIVNAIILISTGLVILILGGPLITNTIRELRNKRITIESLFAITLIGSFIASLESYIKGNEYTYFEVVPILLIVYNIGNLLVSRMRTITAMRASLWVDQINYAHKVTTENKTVIVPVDTIDVNDIVQVSPGETIPVDGIIIEGSAYIFSGSIRGDPFPDARGAGESVTAGEIVYDAVIRIRATSRGTNRQIDSIVNIINQAHKRSGSIRYISDKLSKWFISIIISISLITYIYWFYIKEYSWDSALYYSMSVLLVACPCVIGATIPLIQWIAVNRLAENGIIIRTGDIIERLAKVSCIVFDKTGTLTEIDRYRVSCLFRAEYVLCDYILNAIYHIEKNMNHPIANLLTQISKKYDKYNVYIYQVKQIPGCGIEAKLLVQDICMILHIGSGFWIKKLMKSDGTDILYHGNHQSKKIYVLCDYKLAMIFEYHEKFINHVYESFIELSKLNLPIIVMTGDHHACLDNLPIYSVYSGLSATEKYQKVVEIKNNGAHVMYIGDGVNDAAALATANVAIALASGVDLAVQASDAILYNRDLRVIPWAIAFSRATMQAIHRNLSRALIYNIIGVGLAACGYLHPVVATLLMAISSICLILSASRIEYSDKCDQVATAPGAAISDDNYQYIAFIHFISFALQGFIFCILLNTNTYFSTLIITSFIIVGITISYLWYIWIRIPHYLDMIIGILSMGNLGMVFGIWLDEFIYYKQHMHYHGDISSIDTFPFMWLGMLLFSNAAMFYMNRRPINDRIHKLSMLLGGNVGMICGMFICMKTLFSYFDTLTHLEILHYLIMSLGMMIGMLIGTYLIKIILHLPAISFRRL